MQKQWMSETFPDQGMKHVVERHSKMIMESVIEETEQKMALEQAMDTAARCEVD